MMARIGPVSCYLRPRATQGLILLLACPVLPLAGQAENPAKQTVGWVEPVRIYPGDLRIRAKIDTGADFSSLHCACSTPIERDGDNWVRFTLESQDGDRVQFERKLHRTARIKRHDGGSQRRMVVLLGVCLGDIYKETEVNLVDRSGLNYPFLIGRNFLAGDFLVDAAATFTTAPNCPQPPKD